MQACKWIIGNTPFLEEAYACWTEALPANDIKKIFIPQNTLHHFDFSPLDKLDPSLGSVYVAFDERFGNFKRAELMQAIMLRGFKLTSFISPNAIVSRSSRIGLNSFISAGSIIGNETKIDYNTVVLPGTIIGNNITIRQSCWIEMGVKIENSASIGAYTILRTGAIIASNIEVGRNSELGWNKRYTENVPAKTIFDNRYHNPIYTYSN